MSIFRPLPTRSIMSSPQSTWLHPVPDASILVATTGTPIFVYNLQPDNACAYPAHVRFLLQEKGDDLSGTNGKQYFRWWSNSAAYQLAPGAANLSAPLTDLSQWTSVFGVKGKWECRRKGWI